MVRPASFGYNEQTAESNTFQKNGTNEQIVHEKALQEFDAFVALLRQHKVNVIVADDTPAPAKPDAMFPNNWVTFHENGDVMLYPMQAENRRYERNEAIIRKLENKFQVKHIIDLSRFELDNKFLEGTGSLVLDRQNKLAYACLSPRTNEDVLTTFCEYFGYQAITFHATDSNLRAIYHTNVMMGLGSNFVVICLDSITDQDEKDALISSFSRTNKAIIEISATQMNNFAGNMLEVQNEDAGVLLVMSKSAYQSLSDEQIDNLAKHAKIVHADLTTIEINGGGSARCMIAEIFLPLIN
jgi:hypothetical protein